MDFIVSGSRCWSASNDFDLWRPAREYGLSAGRLSSVPLKYGQVPGYTFSGKLIGLEAETSITAFTAGRK
jgi:hypothetical protein